MTSGGVIDVFENMARNRDRNYEKAMELSSYHTAKEIKRKVSLMKEPLLRRILNGEQITKEESAELDIIAYIEGMIEDYINEKQK